MVLSGVRVFHNSEWCGWKPSPFGRPRQFGIVWFQFSSFHLVQGYNLEPSRGSRDLERFLSKNTLFAFIFIVKIGNLTLTLQADSGYLGPDFHFRIIGGAYV